MCNSILVYSKVKSYLKTVFFIVSSISFVQWQHFNKYKCILSLVFDFQEKKSLLNRFIWL